MCFLLKFPEFSGYGKFTFFIPVDEAFQVKQISLELLS